MIRIAICDDETAFLTELCAMLRSWAASRELVLQLFPFTNGDKLIAACEESPADLVILDIMMPFPGGMDTAKALRQKESHVPLIFLTSSPEFALESYEVRAFWYLLKPVSEERLFSVLDQWLTSMQASLRHFAARTISGYQNIYLRDVEYLEARNKLVAVVFRDGSVLEIKEPFHRCEEFFTPEKGFYKCHRSYLVALNCVETFSKAELRTKSGARIPISRDNGVAFKDAYFAYMFPER